MRRSALLAAGALATALAAGAPNAHGQVPPAPAAPVPPPSAPAPPTATAPAAPVATPPAADTIGSYTGPNRAVIGTGALAVVVWYVPGVIVASGSRIPGDSHLFVPVLGPWLDLADRPGCGPGVTSCRTETGNQVLLVLDGLFQAWGVTAAVIGLFTKEQPRASTAAVRVAPAQVGATGYGAAVVGSF